MELVDYKTFSKLRFTDFLPPETEVISSMGLECCSSHCADYYEAVGHSYFVFADGSPEEVVEINIDETYPTIPAGTGARMLASVGLPLRFGMSSDEVVSVLGQPEYEGAERRFTRYIVGTKWPYRVGCGVAPDRGLWSLWVVREDFFLNDD